MAELKGCGEERWRQSGEWEQLPVSCSWIDCASYNATTKGDGRGFTEVSKCHWESLSSPDTKPKDGKRMWEGSGFRRGDSSSPTLLNSSLQNVMDAGSLLQFCAAQEKLAEKVPQRIVKYRGSSWVTNHWRFESICERTSICYIFIDLLLCVVLDTVGWMDWLGTALPTTCGTWDWLDLGEV